ncbi:unnamed protein product [Rotaria magnacalcarata]|uniref:Uncharacterized protein n=1 Tax=Rotaria magnacalcarata TaxID=392030 RepID=A0A820GQ79_9BILA|nr:unnamed protein product [Rotaria magnacalcarata]
MSATSTNSADSRALRVYRVPAYQKRTRDYDHHASIPRVRSPAPDSRVYVSRRQSSPRTSTVRIVEVKSPPFTTYMKRFYPHPRTTRVIREQNPLSTDTDSTSPISTPPPISLVKRRRQEPRVVRIATTSTNASSNSDLIVPVAKKYRRTIGETPVTIVSETPLVNRGTSPRKHWKKREKPIPLDLERDVYISDEDYYEEAFPDGTYKPKSYKFCKWCHGKCARRCPHCNYCEWYYSCPCCCWLACLLLSSGLLIGIFTLIGFLPEVNPSRRPVINQEVNVTIRAIQQNLPCDPIATYNASSTLIRCIDTTPVYAYTVYSQLYSRSIRLDALNFQYVLYVLCLHSFGWNRNNEKRFVISDFESLIEINKILFVVMMLKFFSFVLFIVVINAQQFQPAWELNYLFPSMIFEPASKLTPPYKQGIYSYSFVIPPPSTLYGPNVAFYLFAGQPTSKTAEIVFNQDDQFFQTLSEKQYWQSKKIPIPLAVNATKIDLYIRDGDKSGPTYTIHVARATQ